MIEKLSGEYNQGYTKGLLDFQYILNEISKSLGYRKMTYKTIQQLLDICIQNRERIRDEWRGCLVYNFDNKKFIWKNSSKR